MLYHIRFAQLNKYKSLQNWEFSSLIKWFLYVPFLREYKTTKGRYQSSAISIKPNFNELLDLHPHSLIISLSNHRIYPLIKQQNGINKKD